MTVNHHPSEAAIMDYAAGALDEAWSLAVATHLALCPTCRRLVEDMEAVGGACVEDAPPADLSPGCLDAALARLDVDDAGDVVRRSPAPERGAPILPEPLRSYAGGDVDALPWRALGGGAQQLILPIERSSATARLLRIPAGKPVPEHTHRGEEMTLVLSGAFTDSTGRFGRGDLQQADATLSHQPHATDEADCICLAVTDAPLRFSSLVARIAQPFLRI